MCKKTFILTAMILLAVALDLALSPRLNATAADALAIDVCVAPDNGGSADLPADCPYVGIGGTMDIINGLPPNSVLRSKPTMDNYFNIVRTPGGNLGGEILEFDASLLLDMDGTGALAGFSRFLSVPVSVEIHTAVHPPDPVKEIPAELVAFSGQIFGDPDFDQLSIIAHPPSPCHFTLSLRPDGDWNVDSFFDLSYDISFVGAPGSLLDGMSGATPGTIRMQQGGTPWQPGDDHKMHYPQLPDEEGWDVFDIPPALLADDWRCSETGWVKDVHFWGSWNRDIVGEILSFDVRIYSDVPAGQDTTYSHPGDILWSAQISDFLQTPIDPQTLEGWYDPITGDVITGNHAQYFQYDIELDSSLWFWQEQDTVYWLAITAHVADSESTQWGWKSSIEHFNDDAVVGVIGATCVAPDSSGTAHLPADCPYVAFDDKVLDITNGLLAGDTIHMDPVIDNYFNESELPGGALGGDAHTFNANLQLTVQGTGTLAGFNRFLNIQSDAEVHTASRTPGNPTQLFAADFRHFQADLIGDPDFDVLRVTFGTDDGLPSPGQFTLTQTPGGDWNVDSFFDVEYRIMFTGAPGSLLDGLSGTSFGTIRIQQGSALLDLWQELYEPPDFLQSLDLSFVITGGCCEGIRGNVDGDPGDQINIADLTYLVDFLFRGGPAPPCTLEADMNGDSGINVADLTYLVDFLFRGGPPPVACP